MGLDVEFLSCRILSQTTGYLHNFFDANQVD